MVAAGLKDEVAEAILIGCDYTSFGSRMDPGFWRQDMFSSGPFRLGSAVPSIQAQAGNVAPCSLAGGGGLVLRGFAACVGPRVFWGLDALQMKRAKQTSVLKARPGLALHCRVQAARTGARTLCWIPGTRCIG